MAFHSRCGICPDKLGGRLGHRRGSSDSDIDSEIDSDSDYDSGTTYVVHARKRKEGRVGQSMDVQAKVYIRCGMIREGGSGKLMFASCHGCSNKAVVPMGSGRHISPHERIASVGSDPARDGCRLL